MNRLRIKNILHPRQSMLFVSPSIGADTEGCFREFFRPCLLYFFSFEDNEGIQSPSFVGYAFDDGAPFPITGMNRECCLVAFANDDFPKQS